MKNLFITSSFFDVYHLLESFYGESLSGKKVAFISTASLVEEYKGYVDKARNAFLNLKIEIEELNVSEKSEQEINEIFLRNDFIYVSGGNTFYLAQELKKSKADNLIIQHINNGKLYIGESAGSIILSKNIEYIHLVDDKNKATELTNYSGLGVVDFYPLPHFGNEPFSMLITKTLENYNKSIDLIPISNSQVIEVKGNSYKINR